MARPRKFLKVEELDKAIDSYFDECDSSIKVIETDKGPRIHYVPYTIGGLCLHLNITKPTLLDYENNEAYSKFSYSVKRAKQRVENWVETRSLMGDTNAPVSIFNLKYNFGWRDRDEDNKGMTIIINDKSKEVTQC